MASPGGFDSSGGGRGSSPDFSNDTPKFNPTMAVIIIVLIGGCFILGFISVFIRKCMSDQNAVNPTERSRILSMKTGGLDKAAVDALPIVHFKDLNEKNERECPVCLTDFELEDNLRFLPVCKHIFHQECIDMWFDSHSTCPLCRASLMGQLGVVENSNGGQVSSREPAETIVEDPGNEDDNTELQPVSDALEDARRDSSVEAMISREDVRSSARGALSRNSQSFKRAARGVVALERAESFGAAGGQMYVRKPSLERPATPSIRRSSSLEPDLVALRNMLKGGGTSASHRLNAMRSPGHRSDALADSWFTRARSMGSVPTTDRSFLNGYPTSSAISREEFVAIALGSRKTVDGSGTTVGESSIPAPQRPWSDKWGLSGIRGAMFPRSMSTSDVSSRPNLHQQV